MQKQDMQRNKIQIDMDKVVVSNPLESPRQVPEPDFNTFKNNHFTIMRYNTKTLLWCSGVILIRVRA